MLFQEAAWVTEQATLLDDNGEEYEALVPVSNGCLDCVSGCKSACPYLEFSEVCKLCDGNENFKQSCLRFSDIAGGRMPPVTFGDEERVNKTSTDGDELQALYDGYLHDDFVTAHRGKHLQMLALKAMSMNTPRVTNLSQYIGHRAIRPFE